MVGVPLSIELANMMFGRELDTVSRCLDTQPVGLKPTTFVKCREGPL